MSYLINPYSFAGSIYPEGLGSALDGSNTSITLDTTNQKLGSGCYSFNNSSSRVNGSGSITLANNYSISAWVNVNSSVDSGDQAWVLSGGGLYLGLYYTAATSRMVCEYAGAGSGHLFSNAVSVDTWYLMTVVNDGGGNLIFYQDGVSVDTGSTSSAPTPTVWNIGTSATVNLFSGLIDDTAIWNISLPATGTNSVASLYNSGAGALANTVSPQNIMVYYDYNVAGATCINQAVP